MSVTKSKSRKCGHVYSYCYDCESQNRHANATGLVQLVLGGILQTRDLLKTSSRRGKATATAMGLFELAPATLLVLNRVDLCQQI